MKSGIYAIVHVASGRRYIGSSVNITERWRNHKIDLNRSRHGNEHLQRAWLKYGPDAFAFEIVEEVDKSCLLDREQAHLDAGADLFNIAIVAGRPMAGRTHSTSDETKRRIGLANSGRIHSTETREKNRLAKLGTKHTAETRAAMSAARRGKAFGPPPQERRDRISQSLTGRISPKRGIPLSIEQRAKLRAAWVRRKARAA